MTNGDKAPSRVQLDPTNLGRSAEPDPENGDPDAQDDEWVLQADAAEIVGCSVSAIRKWRREGVVADRRTTTAGGLERVEVRLQDVVDRCGREPQRTIAVGGDPSTAANQGMASIPFGDLQALILSLGDAERRAQDGSARMAEADAETERLSELLARSDADLASVRAEAERLRRLVRELESGAVGDRPPAGDAAESQHLREQLSRLEARMAESRSEVDGHRRRIRELEAHKAQASQNARAAEVERDQLRERSKRLESRLATAKSDADRQSRRIRELEAHPPATASSEANPATDAENERLYGQLVKLEAHLAEVTGETDTHVRRIAELEARLASLLGNRLVADDENERLREQVSRLEARLSSATQEVDGLRQRIRELESAPVRQPDPGGLAAPGSRAVPTRRARPAPPPPAGPYDDEPEVAPSSAPVPAPNPTDQNGLMAETGVVARRSGPRPRDAADSGPAPEPEPEGDTATRLRQLYLRLHARPRDEPSSPEEQRQWIADLAAYDRALILACVEFCVPTSFQPGDRIPAEDRVSLTRALREAGVSVTGE